MNFFSPAVRHCHAGMLAANGMMTWSAVTRRIIMR